MAEVLTILVGYLIGSMPTGYLVGRSRGLDIRKLGSGNIGATNVLRFVGKKWGFFVFGVDLLKGTVATQIPRLYCANASISCAALFILGGVACILGHNYTCWLGFKGGKGVATSAGVALGLLPIAGIIALLVWIVVNYATGYVAIASIVAAIALPSAAFLLFHFGKVGSPIFLYFAVPAAAMVIWRHRSNIQRLMNGTEHRFKKQES
jgi:glycerol-3-phosphate acyltransferase PlsY